MSTPAVPRPARDRIVTSLGHRRRAILDVIGRAEREISLSMFRCDDDEILEGLAGAAGRGVAVDVLVTRRTKDDPGELEEVRRTLQRAGAAVHTYADPTVKYNAKYLVADSGPAIVSSLNFTQKCFEQTLDALVVTYDPQIVSGLRRLIDADCRGLPLPDSLSVRLIVGPEHARRQFKALIAGARSSIRVIDAKLSDAHVLSLLDAKRKQGLKVEILGSRKLGGLKSHGKIMLVDDRIAVVGSVALTAPSLDLRRELAVVIDEPTAVAEIRRLFDFTARPRARHTAAAAAEGWALC